MWSPASPDGTARDQPVASRRSWTTNLQVLGSASWSALGIIIVSLLVASALGTLSGIVIPLLVALILGAVLEPLVAVLERLRAPKALAAAVGLVVTVATAAGIVAVVVSGFVRQLPEISQQLTKGWNSLIWWIRSRNIDSAWLDRLRIVIDDVAPQVGGGVFGFITNTFYGVVSFGIGLFFAMFLLFFVLRDGERFPAWLARLTSQDEEVVARVTSLGMTSLRNYFRGTAITAIITAPIFVVPLLLLRIPLVVPIIIVYFFLSFIPYVGPWITGAFAVLVAFGSGGAPAALIVAVSLLVSNGTVQSVVSSWALGSALNLHPVAVLLATLVGGVAAGLLGMILGPPLLAAAHKTVAALREPARPDGIDVGP